MDAELKVRIEKIVDGLTDHVKLEREWFGAGGYQVIQNMLPCRQMFEIADGFFQTHDTIVDTISGIRSAMSEDPESGLETLETRAVELLSIVTTIIIQAGYLHPRYYELMTKYFPAILETGVVTETRS